MRTFLAILFLCSAAAGAHAQVAMLWVPSNAPGAAEIVGLLEADKDLRLTAAFSELPKGLEERIKKLEKDGRLELALRPAGDPPLPLFYYPDREEVRWAGKPSTAALASDQYFLALRLGLAKEAALKSLKTAPAGLVSPPGGLVPDLFPLAKALGIKWLACGPFPSTGSAVLEADGVYAVPFVKFSTAQAGIPAFVVFDETAETDPGALRARLAAELGTVSPLRRITVSEALKLAVSSAAAPAEISRLVSPWSGDYSPWASSPIQAGALAALSRTRADLMLHLNAVQGSYKAAKPAFDEYFSAEEGAKLLALRTESPDTARETEIEIQNALGNAYRIMQRTMPPWLFSSLTDAAAAPERSEKIRITAIPGGFEIVNVSRKPEIPTGTAQLPKTADPYRIWKLSSFKMEAGPDNVVFKFYPAELDNTPRLRSGFSHARFDLYIDINHRPRAGTSRPLDGRPLRFFPENAWEYALEITPLTASLYTVTPKGPVLSGAFQPRAEAGAVTVTVPRTALKGNPLLWGYAALMLAPKDGKNFIITDYIAADISNGYIYTVRPGEK